MSCRGPLLVVNPESTEESRQPHHACVGVPEAQQQVPVEGVPEGLVQASARCVPDAPTPEERLLWDEVRECQNGVVVRRQDPRADLAVLGVDQEAVAVDDVDVGVRNEVVGDVGE
jgi:hypothetical protein